MDHHSGTSELYSFRCSRSGLIWQGARCVFEFYTLLSLVLSRKGRGEGTFYPGIRIASSQVF